MPRTKPAGVLPRVGPFKQTVTAHGYSYTTMRDAHFRGELAIIKIGRAWYIAFDELARFAERHTEHKASGE